MNLLILFRESERGWEFLEQHLKHLKRLLGKTGSGVWNQPGRKDQSDPAPNACCSSELVNLERIIINVKS